MGIEEIGEQIKQRRDILHIQQKDLAELSGVSLRTIIQIESGLANPSINTLQKLAQVVGMQIQLVIKNK